MHSIATPSSNHGCRSWEVFSWQTSDCWLGLRVMSYMKRDDEPGESCLDPSQTVREKIKVKSCCQSKKSFPSIMGPLQCNCQRRINGERCLKERQETERAGLVSEAETLERRQRGRNIRKQQEDWMNKREKGKSHGRPNHFSSHCLNLLAIK